MSDMAMLGQQPDSFRIADHPEIGASLNRHAECGNFHE
jgi:hypothetical protein